MCLSRLQTLNAAFISALEGVSFRVLRTDISPKYDKLTNGKPVHHT